jgi:ubiquinone/menaquinone biosynthesis C-methylase UbiE
MNYEQIEDELQIVLDDSLSPRGPELLFDYVADLGIDSNSTVLDLGCNMGKHSFELNRRFGCKVVGVDPGEDYIAQAMARAESDGVVDSSVTFRRGSGEAIPADDESFDLVWCRDVLELVSDLDTTYKEIGRILKRKGRALVYTMCATDLLEPHEAERLYSGLDDVKAKSMLPSTHEEAISKSGLKIISSDDPCSSVCVSRA